MPSSSILNSILNDHDILGKNFRGLLEYNYSPSQWGQDEDGLHEGILPRPPLNFYDLHVDSRLILKAVKKVEFPLNQYLMDFFGEEVRIFRKRGHHFPAPESLALPKFEKLYSILPREVWGYYRIHIRPVASGFASNMYFCPQHPKWSGSLFCFDVPGNDRNPGFCQEVGLTVSPLDEVLTGDGISISEHLLDVLQPLSKARAHFAIWEVFSLTRAAKALLGALGLLHQFPWMNTGTQGHSILLPFQTPPPDARIGIAAQLATTESVTPIEPSTTSKEQLTNKVIQTAPRVGTRRSGRKTYTPSPEQHMQRAWTRAAETDSTFIVFHCGRYERIGIRHRGTQTLYLSELIDTVLCSDPTYRSLQVALLLAIVKDMLDRRDALDCEEGDEASARAKKRRREVEPEDGVQLKRQKLSPDVGLGCDPGSTSALTLEDLEQELEPRILAVVYLNYSCYRSPTPSSFHRVAPACTSDLLQQTHKKQQRKFSPFQYFTLLLGKPLAEGAIGVGHPAQALFMSSSGSTRRFENLVLKLAFGKDEQEKLWHEYKVYQHMWQNKEMKGIVRVFGLFQDAETGTLALMMEHGGISATMREAARTGQISVLHLTTEERDSLVSALTSIHDAGVVHGDFRTDNIVIDNSNQFRIIDFDRAIFEDPKTSGRMVFEMDELNELVEVDDS
ncbi:unnamed protein product [Cyclocybe aegerita]|uniref:Protein kinase domain-containing protein n=1 Tax=Cyclocybe aegerita TaxID=1973307 RepID=A0A8S0VSS5_CYCAE|nr:unnamed protein product [Cyclocybe aegerita]